MTGGTWQHRKADRDALRATVRSLRVGAEIPLRHDDQLVLERQIDVAIEQWRRGALPLPEIRAVEIDGRVCGVVRGLGWALTRWLSRDVWRLHKALVRPVPGAVSLIQQGMSGAVGNLRRDVRHVAATSGGATVVRFDLKGFFESQSPERALDELDRLTGKPSCTSMALRTLYRHAHASDRRLKGIVQGLAPSPALAELLVRSLDEALAGTALVRRWADDIALIFPGVLDADGLVPRVIDVCGAVSEQPGTDFRPHGFQYATYTNGFDQPIEFLNLVFEQNSVKIAPSKLLEIAEKFQLLADLDPDHAITYARSLLRYYRPILTPDGLNDLDSILSEDRANQATSLSLSPMSAVGLHGPSAAEPAGSDGSPPSGVQDTRDRAGERGADASAEAPRSPSTGAARRYIEVIADLDKIERQHMASDMAWKTERFSPMHFWLSRGTVDARDGQYEIVEDALKRAASITARSSSAPLTFTRGQHLALISLHFLATNNFDKENDPGNLARVLAGLSESLGLELLAIDPVTKRVTAGTASPAVSAEAMLHFLDDLERSVG